MKDADLKIGADTSEANAEFEKMALNAMTASQRIASSMREAGIQMSEALTQAADKINSSFGGIQGTLLKLNMTLFAIQGVLSGGRLFGEVIGDSLKLTGEVTKLHKAFGMSYEEASQLNVALKLTGQTADDFAGIAFKLLKQINSNGKGLEGMGLQLKDAHGNMLPLMDIMKSGASLLLQYKEGVDRDEAAMSLFGRSAQESMNILKLNTQVMERAKQMAEQYGIVVGPDGAVQARAYKQEQAAIGIVMEAMRDKIAEAAMPELMKLAGWFTDVGPTAIEVITFSLKHLIQFVEETVLAFRLCWNDLKGISDMMTTTFGTMGAVVVSALKGNFKDIPTILEEGGRQIEQVEKTHMDNYVRLNQEAADRVKKLWSENKAAGGGGEADTKDGKRTWQGKKDSGSQGNVFQEWKSALEQKKESEGEYFKSSLAMEQVYWQEKLILVTGNSRKEVLLRQQIQHELYGIHKQQASEDRAIEAERLSHQQAMARVGVEQRREELRLKTELGGQSNAQEAQALRGFTDKEYDIDLDALNKRMELYKDDAKEYQKLLDQKELMLEEHKLQVKKIEADQAAAQLKTIQQYLQPVSSAFDSSVKGMIAGTTTMHKAMANIGQAIAAEFMNLGVKIGTNWIATEILKTQATLAGVEARTAAEEGGATQSLLISSGTAIKGILNDAWEAMAGAFKAIVGIPVVGPAMAPAAGAAAFAAVAGFAGNIASARGGYDIPGGINPLTQLHEKEMVLPEKYADVVRSVAGQGGSRGGGDVHHYHIHAMDVKSFAEYVKSNSHVLPPAIQRAARNFGFNRRF